MRHKLKSILTSAIVLSMLTTNVYAQELSVPSTETITETTTEVTLEPTLYLKEFTEPNYIFIDNTLWVSYDNKNFEKILDNVASFKNFYRESLILFENGVLNKATYDYEINKLVFEEFDDNVKSVTYNYESVYILKNDNSLWAYRTTYNHDLDETTENILISENIKSISSTTNTLYFIDNENKLFILGDDVYSNYEYLESPKFLLADIKDVFPGDNSIAILDTNDDMYVLKRNYNDYDELFEKILVGNDIKKIIPTNNGTFIIKNDNSLWANGNNYNGNLGTGLPTFYNDSNDFIKVTDDVLDINVNNDHTIIFKKDGSIYGMGDTINGQLGNVEIPKNEYHDENGFYLITEDVKDVEFNYATYILKNDNSLWKIGNEDTLIYNDVEDDSLSENDILEPVLITSDVKSIHYQDNSILYIKGDNDTLYYEGYLGNIISYDFYDEKLDIEEYEQYIAEMTKDGIATNVLSATENFYIDKNHDLYKIKPNLENELIESNVKSILSSNLFDVLHYIDNRLSMLITDMNDDLLIAYLEDSETFTVDRDFDFNNIAELYPNLRTASLLTSNNDDFSSLTITTPKENIEFEKTDLTNIKDLKSNFNSLLLLDYDGNLWKYTPNYFANATEEETTSLLQNMDRTLLDTDVSSIASGLEHFVYIKNDGSLWGFGNNTEAQLSYLNDSTDLYIYEPVKIMDNAKKVVANNKATLVLTEDGKLYGLGQNVYGEFGYKGNGYSYSRHNMYTPIELDFNLNK